tara:strand:- start:7092 stop:7577 length:486 start_codon:yes stop_codon:yes gene_type:complete
MNQGLLIIVLLLLVLLLSCKAFNYCVLKELFINKETVKKMMNDIYDVKEDFRICTEDEKRVMLSSTIAKECENFVGSTCDPTKLSVEERKELVEAGKCPSLETFQNRCCKDENDLLRGGCIPCDGFENYSPFKETFQGISVNCDEDPSNPLCHGVAPRRSY